MEMLVEASGFLYKFIFSEYLCILVLLPSEFPLKTLNFLLDSRTLPEHMPLGEQIPNKRGSLPKSRQEACGQE